ncbi:hypothetical protein [Bacteriovorax sp. DB6_IX]|nr:hypothetical protein [Bacteriovorax sp. DB6_IX]
MSGRGFALRPILDFQVITKGIIRDLDPANLTSPASHSLKK